MHEKPNFCTCGDKNCPHNPINHDKGCTLCIEKNLKEGEIPSCFFNAVGKRSEGGYSYEDFARHVIKTKRDERIRKLMRRGFIILAVVLVVMFGIMVGFDWYRYNNSLNSAPFSVFVLVRALECGVPALLSLVIAFFAGKRPKEDKDETHS